MTDMPLARIALAVLVIILCWPILLGRALVAWGCLILQILRGESPEEILRIALTGHGGKGKITS